MLCGDLSTAPTPSMRTNTVAFGVALACVGLTDTQAFTGPALTASRSRSSGSTRAASTAAADSSTDIGETAVVDTNRSMQPPWKIRGLEMMSVLARCLVW